MEEFQGRFYESETEVARPLQKKQKLESPQKESMAKDASLPPQPTLPPASSPALSAFNGNSMDHSDVTNNKPLFKSVPSSFLALPPVTASVESVTSSSSTRHAFNPDTEANNLTNLCALLSGSITQYIAQYGTKYQSKLVNKIFQRVESGYANEKGKGQRPQKDVNIPSMIDHMGDLKQLYNIAGHILWLHAVNHVKVHVVKGCTLPLDASKFDSVIQDVEKDTIAARNKDALEMKMDSGSGDKEKIPAIATDVSTDEQQCSLIDFEKQLKSTVYGDQDYENAFKYDPTF